MISYKYENSRKYIQKTEVHYLNQIWFVLSFDKSLVKREIAQKLHLYCAKLQIASDVKSGVLMRCHICADLRNKIKTQQINPDHFPFRFFICTETETVTNLKAQLFQRADKNAHTTSSAQTLLSQHSSLSARDLHATDMRTRICRTTCSPTRDVTLKERQKERCTSCTVGGIT